MLDSLLQNESATVYDPTGRVRPFSVRVVSRALVVVDENGVALGIYGSVKAAMMCGTKLS